MRFVITVEDTGLGNPLQADTEGKPMELFVGSLAFQVKTIAKAKEA